MLDKVQVKTFLNKLDLQKKNTQKLEAAQASLKLFQYLTEPNLICHISNNLLQRENSKIKFKLKKKSFFDAAFMKEFYGGLPFEHTKHQLTLTCA